MSFSNPHQLIERENTFNIHKKLLTVHSNDRDTKHYSNSNEFSIKCPTAYTNIQSIIINDFSIPLPIYNFSDKLFNTKFIIKIVNRQNITYSITIPSGHYTPTSLAKILQEIINKKISPLYKFKIYFNILKSKFFIFSNVVFTIHNYTEFACNISFVNTGLLYHIGFNSTLLNFTESKMDTINHTKHYNYIDVSSVSICNYTYVYEADNMYRFLNNEPIYMEIDKLNIYDELNPHPSGSNNVHNNFSNSSVNTAFLKIPVSIYNQTMSRQYNNVISFNPPISRLNTLQFKFRYHDGRLVDFNNQDMNFTLEFIQLRGEIPQHINIRMPIYK